MAIAKIKKLTIIGLRTDRDRILGFLQASGVAQLIRLGDNASRPALVSGAGGRLSELQDSLAFLAGYQAKPSFFASMLPIKAVVQRQRMEEILRSFDWQAALASLEGLRNQVKNFHHQRDKLIHERLILRPWKNLIIPLDAEASVSSCSVAFGIVPLRERTGILDTLERADIPVSLDVVNQDKSNQYCVLTHLRQDFERLEPILKNSHFVCTHLGSGPYTVAERLREIDRQILALDEQLKDISMKLAQMAESRFQLMVVHDVLSSQLQRVAAGSHAQDQAYTFRLDAWIKKRDLHLVQSGIPGDAALFIADPAVGEAVPVALENKPFIQPFEFITQIYGMPQYNELDPTPYLAPFFFLYFGFCVSDVGYGLILIALSWFVLKKIRMGTQGKKFFRLFLYCGVSTVAIGALTGGWFGNFVDILGDASAMFVPFKKFKDAIILLDPMKDPSRLLGIALSFGIVQVWFGVLIAAVGNIKNRRYVDIILDQVPLIVFLLGLTGSGLIFLNVVSPQAAPFFGWGALASGLMLAATQGRAEKGIGSKIFYGLYNLYNTLSGYLSDVLSYSRLWALGLVTGAMASTINLIALQFSQILLSFIPGIERAVILKFVLSVVVFSVIFIVGHAVSFFMNLLGAFVHPLRLQFVEFFSKFFKPGGAAFKPFKTEARYIHLQS
jgi:V/A-type H+-transporting ATPase subunit I